MSAIHCFFCGGKECKYENWRLWTPDKYAGVNAIDGLYSSWITDDILAMQRPSTRLINEYGLVKKFQECGIRSIFNLQESGEHASCGDGIEPSSGFSYLPETWMDNGIFYYNFGWTDMDTPDNETMMNIVQVMSYALESRKKIAVHCHAGLGLTIACYLVYGLNMPAETTKKQVLFVSSFEEYLGRLRLVFPRCTIKSQREPHKVESFTLQKLLEHQKKYLHGVEQRNLRSVPKLVYRTVGQILRLCAGSEESCTVNVHRMLSAFLSFEGIAKFEPKMIAFQADINDGYWGVVENEFDVAFLVTLLLHFITSLRSPLVSNEQIEAIERKQGNMKDAVMQIDRDVFQTTNFLLSLFRKLPAISKTTLDQVFEQLAVLVSSQRSTISHPYMHWRRAPTPPQQQGKSSSRPKASSRAAQTPAAVAREALGASASAASAISRKVSRAFGKPNANLTVSTPSTLRKSLGDATSTDAPRITTVLDPGPRSAAELSPSLQPAAKPTSCASADTSPRGGTHEPEEQSSLRSGAFSAAPTSAHSSQTGASSSVSATGDPASTPKPLPDDSQMPLANKTEWSSAQALDSTIERAASTTMITQIATEANPAQIGTTMPEQSSSQPLSPQTPQLAPKQSYVLMEVEDPPSSLAPLVELLRYIYKAYTCVDETRAMSVESFSIVHDASPALNIVDYVSRDGHNSLENLARTRRDKTRDKDDGVAMSIKSATNLVLSAINTVASSAGVSSSQNALPHGNSSEKPSSSVPELSEPSAQASRKREASAKDQLSLKTSLSISGLRSVIPSFGSAYTASNDTKEHKSGDTETSGADRAPRKDSLFGGISQIPVGKLLQTSINSLRNALDMPASNATSEAAKPHHLRAEIHNDVFDERPRMQSSCSSQGAPVLKHSETIEFLEISNFIERLAEMKLIPDGQRDHLSQLCSDRDQRLATIYTAYGENGINRESDESYATFITSCKAGSPRESAGLRSTTAAPEPQAQAQQQPGPAAARQVASVDAGRSVSPSVASAERASTTEAGTAASSVRSSTSGVVPLFELQQMAPAPSQTFYHFVVLPADPRFATSAGAGSGGDVDAALSPNRAREGSVTKKRVRTPSNSKRLDPSANFARMREGCVVLRDWPRKRMSQSWSRSGMLNPGQKIVSFQDFLDGELKDELTYLFGEMKYRQAVKAVKQHVFGSDAADEDEEMAPPTVTSESEMAPSSRSISRNSAASAGVRGTFAARTHDRTRSDESESTSDMSDG
ncbi:hypothetical protein HK105_200630 [Polyrhizophydium stewartii]|uniref:Uncharacterized protein n=1 Tax=Polyrhizophydium stewartii TaxID=2732419 RepID=A0ABR4NJK9_9FUNG